MPLFAEVKAYVQKFATHYHDAIRDIISQLFPYGYEALSLSSLSGNFGFGNNILAVDINLLRVDINPLRR
jgi:hypothetical protein